MPLKNIHYTIKKTKASKRRIILHYTIKKLQPNIPTRHYSSAPVIIKRTQIANYIHWTNKAHTSWTRINRTYHLNYNLLKKRIGRIQIAQISVCKISNSFVVTSVSCFIFWLLHLIPACLVSTCWLYIDNHVHIVLPPLVDAREHQHIPIPIHNHSVTAYRTTRRSLCWCHFILKCFCKYRWLGQKYSYNSEASKTDYFVLPLSQNKCLKVSTTLY